MKVLVSGSSGHLGEALMRHLAASGHQPHGIDIVAGPRTDETGSICDAGFVAAAMCDRHAVLHSAALHKPHLATHSKAAFIDVNIKGTLTLLEAVVAAGVPNFVYTSTTSAFGAGLTPPPGDPAVWIDGWTLAIPKNIYGATKSAAEDLCHLFHRREGLNVTILRISRLFPEPDDSPQMRAGFADVNVKANEFLFRRVDIEDAATAHLAALEVGQRPGFGRYVISASTPFLPEDCAGLRRDAVAVLRRRVPQFEAVYRGAGYSMFPSIDRVYANDRAIRDLGWRPQFDFARILDQLRQGAPIGSDLSRVIGIKGYHGDAYADGLYPVD